MIKRLLRVFILVCYGVSSLYLLDLFELNKTAHFINGTIFATFWSILCEVIKDD